MKNETKSRFEIKIKKNVLETKPSQVVKKGRFTITKKPLKDCRSCDKDTVLDSKINSCINKKSERGIEIQKCRSEKVSLSMREFKSGELKSSANYKVTNRKQALAIGLSEACRKC